MRAYGVGMRWLTEGTGETRRAGVSPPSPFSSLSRLRLAYPSSVLLRSACRPASSDVLRPLRSPSASAPSGGALAPRLDPSLASTRSPQPHIGFSTHGVPYDLQTPPASATTATTALPSRRRPRDEAHLPRRRQPALHTGFRTRRPLRSVRAPSDGAPTTACEKRAACKARRGGAQIQDPRLLLLLLLFLLLPLLLAATTAPSSSARYLRLDAACPVARADSTQRCLDPHAASRASRPPRAVLRAKYPRSGTCILTSRVRRSPAPPVPVPWPIALEDEGAVETVQTRRDPRAASRAPRAPSARKVSTQRPSVPTSRLRRAARSRPHRAEERRRGGDGPDATRPPSCISTPAPLAPLAGKATQRPMHPDVPSASALRHPRPRPRASASRDAVPVPSRDDAPEGRRGVEAPRRRRRHAGRTLLECLRVWGVRGGARCDTTGERAMRWCGRRRTRPRRLDVFGCGAAAR
ncbi:hypothetical protein B0H15DRAFT_958369 [Mycena belliarum]|uniref:Uncharacterized protein n=1 Tax=Mycena belliarum TaxID=1033014 RepID=A0AAD6TKM7_9AGAR|nr:hypothetical protein B0H15DRAFT_958369 [Mycena belliae]